MLPVGLVIIGVILQVRVSKPGVVFGKLRSHCWLCAHCALVCPLTQNVILCFFWVMVTGDSKTMRRVECFKAL